jgi:2-polyprenyl-6-methoxyphenol hydroxylase-like FAD-dependent oxidoreductase
MFRHDHRVTVLERDRSPDARTPGGTLDLHARLGQLALDKAGLLPEFQARSRPEGQAMRILDTDGAVLRDWRPAPGESANPEIDRGQLRDLLMTRSISSGGEQSNGCLHEPAMEWLSTSRMVNGRCSTWS